MKRVAILFAVFVGLSLFVYFYEIKGGEERDRAKELEESLLRMEEEEVSRIEIIRPGEEALILQKEGEDWLLRSPIQASVDRFVVDGLVRDLANAKRERTLDETADPNQYGLSDPRLQLKIRTAERQAVLNVGLQDYTGNLVYARFESENTILLTGKTIFDSSNKNAFELRDKAVLDFEQDDIQAVEITASDQPRIALQKEDSRWFLEAPLRDDADSGSVSSLLSAVKFARIDRFEDENATELEPYGLDVPSYVLRLKIAEPEEWKVLSLGNKVDEGYYARTSERPAVFVVKETVAEKLALGSWDYRSKKVVPLNQDEIDRLEWTMGEKRWVVVRTGSEWQIEAPEEGKGKKTATYKFWYPVSDIEFETIDDDPSAGDKARFDETLSLALTGQDGSVHHFDFAESAATYRARRRESGKQGTISEQDFKKLAELTLESLSTE